MQALIINNNFTEFSGVARLLLACFFGGLIGLERESKHKPVGFKTCVIISLVSCLLTLVSIKSAFYYAEYSQNIRTDPMRLAAQIISGIGFIGAGVILLRSNQIISGLTTAAIIWSTAGIGISCGSGFYIYAFLTTLLILAMIKFSNVINRLSDKISKSHYINTTVLVFDSESIKLLLLDLEKSGYYIENIKINDNKKKKVEVTFNLNVKSKTDIFLLYTSIKNLEYVHCVSLNQ